MPVVERVDAALAVELAERVVRLEAALRELRLTARILLQNAAGCAAQHHGVNYGSEGEPGWFRDSRLCIERAEAVLQKSQAST